jgi:hypothetical protein
MTKNTRTTRRIDPAADGAHPSPGQGHHRFVMQMIDTVLAQQGR